MRICPQIFFLSFFRLFCKLSLNRHKTDRFNVLKLNTVLICVAVWIQFGSENGLIESKLLVLQVVTLRLKQCYASFLHLVQVNSRMFRQQAAFLKTRGRQEAAR